MIEKIIGIRPEIGSPYSIHEALLKPKWGFPGGRLESVEQAINSTLNKTKSYHPLMKFAGGLFAVGAVVYGIYKGFDWLLGDDSDYIPASALGQRGSRLENALFGEAEELSQYRKASMQAGKYFHEVAQEIFEVTGAESEVAVSDATLGIRGMIDVVLPGNIPVEIKTLSSESLEGLGRPLEAHVSQLNFYMHARKAKLGYVVYLDGSDISNRKVFRVGYQPGRLIADVDAVRDTMLFNPERASNKQMAWMQERYRTSPAFFRGIRHSTGSASSFDSMGKGHNFPAGRIASVIQASRYTPHTEPKRIPTLGLAIRNHETAINHRAKGRKAKRPGANHCNKTRQCRW